MTGLQLVVVCLGLYRISMNLQAFRLLYSTLKLNPHTSRIQFQFLASETYQLAEIHATRHATRRDSSMTRRSRLDARLGSQLDIVGEAAQGLCLCGSRSEMSIFLTDA